MKVVRALIAMDGVDVIAHYDSVETAFADICVDWETVLGMCKGTKDEREAVAAKKSLDMKKACELVSGWTPEELDKWSSEDSQKYRVLTMRDLEEGNSHIA
jgi:hypothetical protein